MIEQAQQVNVRLGLAMARQALRSDAVELAAASAQLRQAPAPVSTPLPSRWSQCHDKAAVGHERSDHAEDDVDDEVAAFTRAAGMV
jgi:hypothetical protein